mgnify:CR=1 FL=1
MDDTVDPYSKLVYEGADGSLSTGNMQQVVHRDQVLEGGHYLTRSEVQAAGGGITREPAAVWTARDDFQQKLVQLGRRLPYELPALYITQRAVTDPLFGNNQDSKKVKWYNPADVVADLQNNL